MRFVVITEGQNKLNLRALAEGFANELWIPTHLTTTQAEDFALDHFKRAVAAALELLDVKAVA